MKNPYSQFYCPDCEQVAEVVRSVNTHWNPEKDDPEEEYHTILMCVTEDCALYEEDITDTAVEN